MLTATNVNNDDENDTDDDAIDGGDVAVVGDDDDGDETVYSANLSLNQNSARYAMKRGALRKFSIYSYKVQN